MSRLSITPLFVVALVLAVQGSQLDSLDEIGAYGRQLQHFRDRAAARDPEHCLKVHGGKDALEGKKLIEDKNRLTDDIVVHNPATEVLESSLGSTRVFHPNQLGMTMDYRRDRLNIYLDEDNIINDVNCG